MVSTRCSTDVCGMVPPCVNCYHGQITVTVVVDVDLDLHNNVGHRLSVVHLDFMDSFTGHCKLIMHCLFLKTYITVCHTERS